jgi:hypothetical protein
VDSVLALGFHLEEGAFRKSGYGIVKVLGDPGSVRIVGLSNIGYTLTL